jgi:hypothetical protein
MNAKQEEKKYILENLSSHLFWDVDRTKLDIQKNRNFIISRIFDRGDLNDLKAILNIYDIEIIKNEIIKAGFLDKKTINWVSNFLKIPKTKFLCYKKMQSSQVHWSF